jgi:hypothetical protein
MKKLLFTTLLFAPLTVFAHGEEVIILLGVNILIAIISILVLLGLNMTLKGKLLLALIYISTYFIILLATADIAYNENLLVVDSTLTILPILVSILAYYKTRIPFRKE